MLLAALVFIGCMLFCCAVFLCRIWQVVVGELAKPLPKIEIGLNGDGLRQAIDQAHDSVGRVTARRAAEAAARQQQQENLLNQL